MRKECREEKHGIRGAMRDRKQGRRKQGKTRKRIATRKCKGEARREERPGDAREGNATGGGGYGEIRERSSERVP